jgi:hypothetical protein
MTSPSVNLQSSEQADPSRQIVQVSGAAQTIRAFAVPECLQGEGQPPAVDRWLDWHGDHIPAASSKHKATSSPTATLTPRGKLSRAKKQV